MQITNFLPHCRPHHHLAPVVLKQSMDTSDSVAPGEAQSAKEARLANWLPTVVCGGECGLASVLQGRFSF